ncbi:hypothetical protein SALBM217S_02440 [Streptomyces griseoloalbus]
MRRLFPVTDVTDETGAAGGAAGREWSLAELAAAYAYPEPGPEGPAPWLRGNMVSTLDGAAQHEGRSQPISCPADMRIFGVLRALADAVVVGAETVRQEVPPGPRPRRVRSRPGGRRTGPRARDRGGLGEPGPGLLAALTSPLVPLVLTGAAADPERVAAAGKAGALWSSPGRRGRSHAVGWPDSDTPGCYGGPGAGRAHRRRGRRVRPLPPHVAPRSRSPPARSWTTTPIHAVDGGDPTRTRDGRGRTPSPVRRSAEPSARPREEGRD